MTWPVTNPVNFQVVPETSDGKVAFRYIESQSFMTRPADTTAYAAGDAVSDVGALRSLIFGGVARNPDGTGTIDKCIITSSANVATRADLELWLFHTPPTFVADNSAWTPTDADLTNLSAIIVLAAGDFKNGDATSGAGGNVAQMQYNLSIPYATRNSTKLHGQLVVRNAYVPVSGEIFTVTLGCSLD